MHKSVDHWMRFNFYSWSVVSGPILVTINKAQEFTWQSRSSVNGGLLADILCKAHLFACANLNIKAHLDGNDCYLHSYHSGWAQLTLFAIQPCLQCCSRSVLFHGGFIILPTTTCGWYNYNCNAYVHAGALNEWRLEHASRETWEGSFNTTTRQELHQSVRHNPPPTLVCLTTLFCLLLFRL